MRRWTQITDAGIKELKQLTELEDLGIGNNQITDAAPNDLGELKSLTRVNLCGTQITKAAASELQNSLPRTDVFR